MTLGGCLRNTRHFFDPGESAPANMHNFIAISVNHGGSGKVWADTIFSVKTLVRTPEGVSNGDWSIRPEAGRMVRFGDAFNLTSGEFSEQRASELISEWVAHFWEEAPLLVFASPYEEDLLRDMLRRCSRVALPHRSVSISELIRAWNAVSGREYPSTLGEPHAMGSPMPIHTYASDLMEKLGA